MTPTITIAPDECFAKAAEALSSGQVEIARTWLQLGEVIVNAKR